MNPIRFSDDLSCSPLIALRWLAALGLAAAGAGCAVPTPGASSPDRQPVSIRFDAQVNGEPFRCGARHAAVGSKASTVTISDFRFYVSEVELIDRSGRAVPVALEQDGRWQLDSIALLDFEDGSGPCRNGTAAVNTSVRGTVPAGEYSGLRFTLGVPFERNHADPTTAPAPLNQTAMFWNWQGGYKFLKVDMNTMQAMSTPRSEPAQPSGASHGGAGMKHGGMHGGGTASGFSVHLGSTLCAAPSPTQSPAACAQPNRVVVQFAQFDPARSVVVADIGQVLAQADVTFNSPGTAPGCMSFPKDADCPPVMGSLGLTYDGRPAPGPQRLFSVR